MVRIHQIIFFRCGPCKIIAPFLDEQAKLHPDNIIFVNVDMDDFGSLVNDAQDVSSMPTFKFFKNGKQLHQFTGAGKKSIETAIEKYS